MVSCSSQVADSRRESVGKPSLSARATHPVRGAFLLPNALRLEAFAPHDDVLFERRHLGVVTGDDGVGDLQE